MPDNKPQSWNVRCRGMRLANLVMDNLSSHNRKALVQRFVEKIGGMLWQRITVHYTPKHGRWLNQAEIDISLFSRQCLKQRRIPLLSDLQREAKAWSQKMNCDHVTINWKFSRKKKARTRLGDNRNNFIRPETSRPASWANAPR